MTPRVMAYRVRHEDVPDTSAAFERAAGLPDGPEKGRTRGEIVCAWLPMADRLAGRFRHRGEALEDLRQVAAIGLVKAVERYDPHRGTAFESFAVPTITGELKRHFRDRLWSVHVPRRVQELRARVRDARDELAQRHGILAPTVEQIAFHAGMTPNEAVLGVEAMDCFNVLSLDASPASPDEGLTLGDSLGAWDEALDAVIDRESVKPRLRRLPDREKRILYMRFFRGMTQSSIAEDLGISQMHVSRLINDSCARIRRDVMRDAA
ncbi:SigB/SigF/SigG family RNA polymerase sigma factor [Streptomyces sp. NP-1717]|uniref:SigB/SigF/SigG family RNA polymerase sigma factor n=1 Tax=Streptomyces sp. NP-1717 TaxID=2704470 RepID=UPI001F5C59C3|nr:SigB/SigF/SigG family RNA polymerase sigma factor [Streptomyces sp. NP-1717]MCI3222882.1 SigB/SigF/SigG family RNA polymerase sigma factor [Streptomyces sp. NP-1717]